MHNACRHHLVLLYVPKMYHGSQFSENSDYLHDKGFMVSVRYRGLDYWSVLAQLEEPPPARISPEENDIPKIML